MKEELVSFARPSLTGFQVHHRMAAGSHWQYYTGMDMRKLEAGVHAVSGTPGRVFDMIKRRSFRTREIKLLVLDEADEMLNQGFKEQIYDVYRYLPPETQVRSRLCCLHWPCYASSAVQSQQLHRLDCMSVHAVM